MKHRYQISFQRLHNVHWCYCNDERTMQFIVDGLRLSGNINIEVLQDPNGPDPKVVQLGD